MVIYYENKNLEEVRNSFKHLKSKTLSVIAEAVRKIDPENTIQTTIPMPKVDFMREVITANIPKPHDLISIDDIILMSGSIVEFNKNLSHMTLDNMKKTKIFNSWAKFMKLGFTFEKTL